MRVLILFILLVPVLHACFDDPGSCPDAYIDYYTLDSLVLEEGTNEQGYVNLYLGFETTFDRSEMVSNMAFGNTLYATPPCPPALSLEVENYIDSVQLFAAPIHNANEVVDLSRHLSYDRYLRNDSAEKFYTYTVLYIPSTLSADSYNMEIKTYHQDGLILKDSLHGVYLEP